MGVARCFEALHEVEVCGELVRQAFVLDESVLSRGRDADLFDRAIDVQVSRLRKLIEPDAANPRYIQTVWGFGYVFVPDDGMPADAQTRAHP
jgi:DNA-binding response OmpR family regulator